MNPIELCAVWKLEDGNEMVQTGIYVPDDTTLKGVRELMSMYENSWEKVPYKVEFKVKEEEEE